ncbi:MAG: hypothetical protein LUG93_16870 [Lachnospiraceae bacterium]|nr:hypothetical protein [Lachnospiraceae bacterium]
MQKKNKISDTDSSGNPSVSGINGPCLSALSFVFIVALLPRLFLSMQMFPVRTISDETATISTGAFFAGLDWSGVISRAGYYGGGFSVLLAPIFRLTDDPVIIYRAALILASVIQSLAAPISYHLMKKYFSVKNKAFLLVASAACSFMVVTRSNITYNEHMLILISWLTAWLLCILYNSRNARFRFFYTLLLAAVLSYALTVHIRATVLWIAITLLVLCYYICTRKWLISKAALIPAGIAGYFLSSQFISFIQNHIWLLNQGETIRNSSINVSTNADLTDPLVWKAWLNIIFGQIYTIGIYSGTILFAAIVLFVPLIFAFFKHNSSRTSAQENELYFILSITFMLCIAATIAGQSVSWLSSAVSAMKGESTYGVKAFTYIRYFGPYCGPVFMITLVYIQSHYQKLKSIVFKTVLLFTLLQTYWVVSIVPYLENTTSADEIFVGFIGATINGNKDIYLYLKPLCILFLLLFIVSTLFYKKQKNAAVFFVSIFLLWEYGSQSVSYDINNSQKNWNKVSSSYTFFKQMQELTGLPDEIYVVDTSSATDHNTYYLFQLCLNRYTIIPDYPEEDCAEAIVFANSAACTELLESGYVMYQLDDNEWVYVYGEGLIEVAEGV